MLEGENEAVGNYLNWSIMPGTRDLVALFVQELHRKKGHYKQETVFHAWNIADRYLAYLA